jgi:hypothetical protein
VGGYNFELSKFRVTFCKFNKFVKRLFLFFLLIFFGMVFVVVSDSEYEYEGFYDNMPNSHEWRSRLYGMKPIDFRAQEWSGSVKGRHLGGEIRPRNYIYTSPSGRYRISYKESKYEDGFVVSNIKTKEVVLVSPHWVINPDVVKWLFDEKYIIYEYRYDQDEKLMTYLGNLETGKVKRFVESQTEQYKRSRI